MKIILCLISTLFLCFSSIANAIDSDSNKLDCAEYIVTTTEVMDHVQNGKNIKDLIDISIQRKNLAVTPKDIELSKVFAAYSIVALKEPIATTVEEKKNSQLKAAYIGQKFCENQQKKMKNQ